MRSLHTLSAMLLALFSVLSVGAAATADEGQADSPKFVLSVDLAGFQSTEIGQQLIEMTLHAATEQIGDGDQNVLDQVQEALGFDPFEEIKSLTVMSSSFEEPQEDLAVIVDMGKTTGNLEGLMLALPGYESHKHGDHTVHSAQEDDHRAYAVITSGKSGNKRILAATQKEQLYHLLADQDAANAGAEALKAGDNCFAALKLLQLPEELTEDGPPATIARMLSDVMLSLSETDEGILARLELTTSDEKKAEQIEQLATGLTAMIGLFKAEIGDNEEAKVAVEMLENLIVARDGAQVIVELPIAEEMVMNAIEEGVEIEL